MTERQYIIKPGDRIEPFWKWVGPEVERAIKSCAVDGVYRLTADGFKQPGYNFILCVEDGKLRAVAVYTFVEWPSGVRDMQVPVVAGEGLSEWMAELEDVLWQLAVKDRAMYMYGYGRKGWRRVLKKWDVEVEGPDYSIYRRKVSNGR